MRHRGPADNGSGPSPRWRVLIGGWIATLIIVAILAYSLSQARAAPGPVRIADVAVPSVPAAVEQVTAVASPTAVPLDDVQRPEPEMGEDAESRLSPTVAPIIVGAMLVIVFIAASQPRRS